MCRPCQRSNGYHTRQELVSKSGSLAMARLVAICGGQPLWSRRFGSSAFEHPQRYPVSKGTPRSRPEKSVCFVAVSCARVPKQSYLCSRLCQMVIENSANVIQRSCESLHRKSLHCVRFARITCKNQMQWTDADSIVHPALANIDRNVSSPVKALHKRCRTATRAC